MVGGHIGNKALKKSEMVFTPNFKTNTGSDMRKTMRMNRNSIMRLAMRKKITADVKKKLKKQHRKKVEKSNI